MRIEGHSYQSIAAHLNELGRLTKRGRPFSGGNNLMEVLCNEKYTGVYVYNRRYKSHINRKKQKVILRFIEKVVINKEDVTIQYKIDDPSSSTPGLVRING